MHIWGVGVDTQFKFFIPGQRAYLAYFLVWSTYSKKHIWLHAWSIFWPSIENFNSVCEFYLFIFIFSFANIFFLPLHYLYNNSYNIYKFTFFFLFTAFFLHYLLLYNNTIQTTIPSYISAL